MSSPRRPTSHQRFHRKAVDIKVHCTHSLTSRLRSIIAKLLAFTFAMITFPISTYFLTKDTIFKGA